MSPNDQLTFVKRIGNFVSNILLGETKELIIRTDEKVRAIQHSISEIQPDLKSIRERFMVVEDHVDTLWKDKLAPSHSPRQLNERGKAILAGSGIKEIIEKEQAKLLGIVREGNVANPYDAERTITDVVAKLSEHCPELVDSLKKGAFRVGADLDAVLFVGGIYLRDLIFKDLGFSLEDLDVPPTQIKAIQ